MSKKRKVSGLSLLGAGKTKYPDSPEKARLESFKNANPDRDYWIKFETSEFTSLCPITGQPDFARIVVDYIPDQLCIESKSLKLYLFSFRNRGSFAEEIVNKIRDDIVKACRPRQLSVTGEFTARGGISITVKAEYSGR
jgi:7-cyano-7-deazaguanine reductase